MSEMVRMTARYCLGYTHTKCEECQHAENWRGLNAMPDSLRISTQRTMGRVDSDMCRLTAMGEHEAISKGGA